MSFVAALADESVGALATSVSVEDAVALICSDWDAVALMEFMDDAVALICSDWDAVALMEFMDDAVALMTFVKDAVACEFSIELVKSSKFSDIFFLVSLI